MVPWIQVYSNLPNHPKTYRLMELLGLKRKREAVGIVVSLWCWAVLNAMDGDLSCFPPKAIADVVEWNGRPDRLYDALITAGWLDRGDDGKLRIHDWEDYASLLIAAEDNRKKKTRERVKRYRETKKPEKSAACNADCNVTVTEDKNVTDTLCNAPTRHNITRPDITRPVMTTTTTGAGAEMYFLARVNPNASEGAKKELAEFETSLGTELCIKAMDMAMDNGKTGWAYIRTILERWTASGIRTVAEVEDREAARKAGRRNEEAAAGFAPGPGEAGSVDSLRRFREALKEEKV